MQHIGKELVTKTPDRFICKTLKKNELQKLDRVIYHALKENGLRKYPLA